MPLPTNENKKKKNILPEVPLDEPVLPDPSKQRKQAETSIPDEDDVFRTLSVEEQEQMEIEEQREARGERRPRNRQEYNKLQTKKNRPSTNQDDEPLYKDHKKIRRIDKKEGKIIPTGGRFSRRVSEQQARAVDPRKDSLKVTKLIRAGVLFFMISLFIMGLINTFFPPKVHSDSEIMALAREAVGLRGFPLERGRAFVEDFITRYLTIDPNNRLVASQLEYFYTGEYGDASNVTQSQRNYGNNVRQRVLYPPKVYFMDSPFPYLGRYEVSVYVSDSDGNAGTGTNYSEWRETAHWLSFRVEVYYDKGSDTLRIIKNSLSVIPHYEIGSATKLPAEKAPGTGQKTDSMLVTLTPTIHGYIEAFMDSSRTSHERIIQYVPTNPSLDLVQGYAGAMALDGPPEQSITKKVYTTNNPNEWKVDCTMKIRDTRSKDYVGYTARYIMTIERFSDDTYLVTKFIPHNYIKADK